MTGRVLIIDSQTNRRIHLRAQLATDAFDVIQADTAEQGLSIANSTPPDAILVAADVPDLRLAQFCRSLRVHPLTRDTAVIVILARSSHDARTAALKAGAVDVLDPCTPQLVLRTRLRALMRDKQSCEEERRLAATEQHPGMSEQGSAFEHPANVTLVSCGLEAFANALKQRLRDSGLPRLTVASPATVRRAPDPDTDVFVVIEAKNGLVARDILGTLRSHPTAKHAKILFLSDAKPVPGLAAPLDLGAQDHVPEDVAIDEIALRLSRLARRKRESDRMRQSLQQLEQTAYVDGLTGLRNRNFADEYLRGIDRDLSEHPRRLALMIADLDHFKTINDTHGHMAGDAVLTHVAALLKANLRDSDMLARYGGEEFLILLPDLGAKEARSVAARLAQAVRTSPLILASGQPIAVTLSLGLSITTRSSRHRTRDLIRAGDAALYRAKHAGRNRAETARNEDFTPPVRFSTWSAAKIAG